ncbi:D-alanyl-lipoteichoic acid biosynthesis protein DltD [Lacticaseibacillus parakribbianus]|uniref:D-alanyl-lipoteichoic acid biosynthesis protein DltD n=1 Tax=Lacticaseibacillus parakribbianus TaxID=2970927 RepID=UPI0021CB3A60|nr:D-alanyl-lipoteichoic acid biosynthesis protein DltD [Lacticaseibacillus parakribbianus]
MKRRVWQIFGPLLIAAGLTLALFLAPLSFKRMSPAAVRSASVAMSPTVLAGARAKNQALAQGAVPFFGSSELSRLDPFHPSALAARYHRNYRPFLIGAPGTQSLTQFINAQTMLPKLRHKKAVFIVSMQWFTRRGVMRQAFDYFYSPLETVTWVLKAKDTVADRYAARRLLCMRAVRKDRLIKSALLQVAAGQKLDRPMRLLLEARLTVLHNEDGLFSHFTVNPHERELARSIRQLPAAATNQQLDALAAKVGAAHTTNNDFGIDDRFFSSRLGEGRLAKMRGKQRSFDYRFGPEYSDFELLLAAFAKYDIDVQFVIPPINAKWASYTGLSQAKLHQAVEKLRVQLQGQGFNRVLDLSRDGNRPYFMQDTIHIGWRGWVRVDRTVAPFLAAKRQPVQYHLNSQFFTKSWRDAVVSGK